MKKLDNNTLFALGLTARAAGAVVALCVLGMLFSAVSAFAQPLFENDTNVGKARLDKLEVIADQLETLKVNLEDRYNGMIACHMAGEFPDPDNPGLCLPEANPTIDPDWLPNLPGCVPVNQNLAKNAATFVCKLDEGPGVLTPPEDMEDTLVQPSYPPLPPNTFEAGYRYDLKTEFSFIGATKEEICKMYLNRYAGWDAMADEACAGSKDDPNTMESYIIIPPNINPDTVDFVIPFPDGSWPAEYTEYKSSYKIRP